MLATTCGSGPNASRHRGSHTPPKSLAMTRTGSHKARNYAAIPLPVAIWSLRLSAEVWCTVLNDAYHHLWDVNRILVRPSA